MLTDSAIISFLATTDPPRSRRFYEDTLGLRFVTDEPFALVFDAGGTMLRVAKVQTLSPAPFTVLGWQVADIRSTVLGLTRRSVTFERYAGMQQDELGIWASPGGALVAWFKDPEGNLLSLTQFPPKRD